ncbi:endonuclease domain-containing 1 protein-like [Hypanus sabinus]|uniref:endonuclease domain-containing 1 protein-like n=1 Tax=Hypanus sabinus TaxID=79690 RepID=UPI0028C3DDA9|nr:endonuclease domain-containing 1 protein-like [Hypanus sabinus]
MRRSEKHFSQKQAVNSDYAKSSYHRGHLYPFDFNECSQKASCTLTNAIPMIGNDNQLWFHNAEYYIKKLADKCNNNSREMYVVTGSANYTGGKMKNRVVVPGLIWSAACCTSSGMPGMLSSTPVTPVNTKVDFSVAYMKELLSGKKGTRISVRQLQRTLNVRIFNQCRGTNQTDEAENDRVVIALLEELRNAGSKRKRPSQQINQQRVFPRKSNSK